MSDAPAGVSLTPGPGVELVFDRAGGRLSQVIVEAGEPGGPVVPGEPAEEPALAVEL